MKIVLRSVLTACELLPTGDGVEVARRRNITIRPAEGAVAVLSEREAPRPTETPPAAAPETRTAHTAAA
jgi:hypothetical protein